MKADILELTVTHVSQLHERVAFVYMSGFCECAEAMLSQAREELGPCLSNRLGTHLSDCLSNINCNEIVDKLKFSSPIEVMSNLASSAHKLDWALSMPAALNDQVESNEFNFWRPWL